MTNNTEREQKLRDAMQEYFGIQYYNSINFIEACIPFIKSDAAKAYHSQVDVGDVEKTTDELLEILDRWCNNFESYDVFKATLKKYIESHLQKQEQQESDAVEFAEWICKKGYNSIQICTHPRWNLNSYCTDPTTQELYKEFINSKTK